MFVGWMVASRRLLVKVFRWNGCKVSNVRPHFGISTADYIKYEYGGVERNVILSGDGFFGNGSSGR